MCGESSGEGVYRRLSGFAIARAAGRVVPLQEPEPRPVPVLIDPANRFPLQFSNEVVGLILPCPPPLKPDAFRQGVTP